MRSVLAGGESPVVVELQEGEVETEVLQQVEGSSGWVQEVSDFWRQRGCVCLLLLWSEKKRKEEAARSEEVEGNLLGCFFC